MAVAEPLPSNFPLIVFPLPSHFVLSILWICINAMHAPDLFMKMDGSHVAWKHLPSLRWFSCPYSLRYELVSVLSPSRHFRACFLSALAFDVLSVFQSLLYPSLWHTCSRPLEPIKTIRLLLVDLLLIIRGLEVVLTSHCFKCKNCLKRVLQRSGKIEERRKTRKENRKGRNT